MKKIAFIGLGAMGEPMASNLLRKGFDVVAVGHRRPEPLERLKALGAQSASDPAAAAKDCDCAVLMLPSSAQVEEAINGPNGLAETLRSGSVVIDCTTSDSASTRKLADMLAQKGIALVDAGVTRGVAGAKQGTLAFYLGGRKEDIERVQDVLNAMGDTFFAMGPVGAGHETKNLSNALSYGTVALVSEIMMLGSRLGLDLKALQEALMCGAASKALEAFGPRIISGEYEPARVIIENVRAHLAMTKDLAGDIDMNVVGTAAQIFDKASRQGLDKADISAVAETWRASSQQKAS